MRVFPALSAIIVFAVKWQLNFYNNNTVCGMISTQNNLYLLIKFVYITIIHAYTLDKHCYAQLHCFTTIKITVVQWRRLAGYMLTLAASRFNKI